MHGSHQERQTNGKRGASADEIADERRETHRSRIGLADDAGGKDPGAGSRCASFAHPRSGRGDGGRSLTTEEATIRPSRTRVTSLNFPLPKSAKFTIARPHRADAKEDRPSREVLGRS